jgi:hypothetical protein
MTTLVINLINDFLKTVEEIYAVFLDSSHGFYLVHQQLTLSQLNTIQKNKEVQTDLNKLEYLDSLPFFYGKGNPNDVGSYILHKGTQGELKKRNQKDGNNYRFAGNMCLVNIYQYWEDYYRYEIAKVIGIEKSNVKIPIMGDINKLRRSIIHHNGIALDDVERTEILKWFKVGDEIYIDEKKMDELIMQIQNGFELFFGEFNNKPA